MFVICLLQKLIEQSFSLNGHNYMYNQKLLRTIFIKQILKNIQIVDETFRIE